MPDDEILFRKLKNVAMRKPGRSQMFQDFVKKYRGGDFHHVFGSLGSLKSTDYLGVSVSRQEHTLMGNDREWLIEQLPEALDNLLKYVAHLEEQLKKK